MNTTRTIVITAVLTSVITTAGILTLFYYGFLGSWFIVPAQTTLDAEGNLASQNNETLSIPDIVAVSAPAVVSIVIAADVPIVERYYGRYRNPVEQWFGDIFGLQVPSERQIGTERLEIGGGTGFFVSPDGYLITNRHVVDDEALEYSIVTDDGQTYGVTVVAKDPSLDIAILKVDAEGTTFPYLTLAPDDQIRLGETVIAIGNALTEFPNSVSVGVVSGLSRSIVASSGLSEPASLDELIQTDAAINRGNSGGPLINTYGHVVGVNVATAGYAENIGFALPVDLVASALKSVQETGEIVRPFLGVRYLAINEEVAARYNLPVDYGVLIVGGATPNELAVMKNSPADKVGLSENDIILAINGQKLDKANSLSSILRTFNVNETITLTVLQDGIEKQIEVQLGRSD